MAWAPDISTAQLAFRVDGLAADRMLVVRFRGTEALSQLYRFEIELVAPDGDVEFESVVNRAAALEINSPDGPRWVHGRVSRLECQGQVNGQATYRAELVPDLWLLTQRYDSRIFQNMSVPEIVAQVLAAAGLPADYLQLRLVQTYAPREYCVQYRETDFDFIARLLEIEGIWWFFEHAADAEQLVCADSPLAPAPVDGDPALPFVAPSGLVVSRTHVSEFRLEQSVRPGLIRLRDFSFENPRLSLAAQSDAGHDLTLGHNDYPGGYALQADGTARAQLRVEELQTGGVVGRGVSDCRMLAAGRTFELSEHPGAALNQGYLLTAVTHEGWQATQRTTTGRNGYKLNGEPSTAALDRVYHAGRAARRLADVVAADAAHASSDVDQPTYQCRFECIPATVTFRPPRVTPWPDVRGTQTARVVGPAGEEIYTDEYGRVKVQFHWDRYGRHDEQSSCWIRVCHGMAGGQYGSLFLPRVGQEVVVDFLEGDPDKPIIIGRVYNADHMPPYALPDNKTRSVIKTQSSKGGGGTNEIRFEDCKDSEQLFVHAQKDYHLRVGNDRVESVTRDRHLTVERHQLELVKQNKHSEVRLDLREKLGGSKYASVAGDVGEDIGGNHHEHVGGHYYLDVDGKLVLESATGICLKVGGNFITINPSGIYLMGTVIHLNGDGSALSATEVAVGAPETPLEADTTEPGVDVTYTADGDSLPDAEFDEPEETSWIEIELVDEAGQPWPNETYEVTEPDGTIHTGCLDENGQAHVGVQDPGMCQISFPKLDRRAWERA